MTRLLTDSRLRVKLIALAILLIVPFQIVFYRAVDKPWPNLQMPPFANVPSEPRHFALFEIHATNVNGERFEVEWMDLFPGIPGIDRSFQSLNFSPRRKAPDPSGTSGKIANDIGSRYPFENYWQFRLGTPHGNDPDVRFWLLERLADQFTDQTFVSLEFAWYEHAGYARTDELPASAIAEVYVVEFN